MLSRVSVGVQCVDSGLKILTELLENDALRKSMKTALKGIDNVCDARAGQPTDHVRAELLPFVRCFSLTSKS